ncbi:RNA polymerase sigma factor [Pseudonocardia pini]|uniref:RNA polymerase sigma factor n=1 Tax=Pseudonocardia pini TaxID=2758030 RepID=UPI0015F123EF|nr:sigma-70 family RNA polymerase sigma factor [Pseudonocardia pini]
MSGQQGVRPDPGFDLLALYDTALPEVYGYLLARCGRRSLAEDLTAETFLAAVSACRSGSPRVTVAWLVGIARHKLADHWRALEVQDRTLRALEHDEAEDPWEAELDALLARETLDAQIPQHRAALTLRYLDGLPVADVARAMDRSVRATEALLVRARSAFRRTYTAYTREGGPA